MKSEFNNYHINNPDGASERHFYDGRLSFGNDNPHYVQENVPPQEEILYVNESSNDLEGTIASDQAVPTSGTTDNSSGSKSDLSSLTSSPSVATTASSVSAAATTSAIGSGIGAVAGVVASAVTTAVIVVAVFISTLSVNLSLVMADMDCLVFRLEMQGAQEQDFENGIYALLDGNDGSHYEQTLNADSIYVTFTDLKPNQSYVVRIKSDEKVFVEQSFFTASSAMSRGIIDMRNEKNNVRIDVRDVVLGSAEFYTLSVTDLQGNLLFVKDDKKTEASYSFSVSEPKTLHCALSIGGVTYAFAELAMTNEPEYNFDSPVWTWASDNTATLSFIDINGGDPLIIPAVITSVDTPPTCEEDGYTTYIATSETNGNSYSDEKIVIREGTACGHDFSTVEFFWEPKPDLSDDGTSISGYDVIARFYCIRNQEHFSDITVDPQEIRHETVLPSCEEDGYTTYTATVTYNNKEYADTRIVTDMGTALGHDYSSTEYIWTPVTGDGITDAENVPLFSVTINFLCAHNGEHVSPDVLTIEPENVDYSITSATCDTDGKITYYAFLAHGDKEYADEKEVVLPALGHDYNATPVFTWYKNGGEYLVTAALVCANDVDQNHDIILETECSWIYTKPTGTEDGYTTYIATVMYNGVAYSDTKIVTDKELNQDGV